MTVARHFDNKTDDKLIGHRLGDYELRRLVATGGMARVYEAVDVKLDRPAAVKVLMVDSGDADSTVSQRFQREARTIARLEHENIITLYQYGEEAGIRFLAMKYVEGKDLSQELARLRRNGHRMPPPRAIHILSQVANAIDYAHQVGIIHRDIKPSNILIDRSDHAMLTDFGLILQSRPDSTETQGTAFGTPRYIAPEQALASQNAVPQSDLYSLAVILYEILTGEPPFTGDTPMEIALGHIGDPPRPPRQLNPDIPAQVEYELLKALDKDPQRRHNSAAEFMQAIKAGYDGENANPAEAASRAWVPAPNPTLTEAPDMRTPVMTDDLGTLSPPPPALAAAQAQPRRARLAPAAVLVIGALLLFLVWFIATSLGSPPARMTLWYDEKNFMIHNGYDVDLNVFKLQFIRGIDGEGRDDFSGDRFARDTIPSGACYTLGVDADTLALRDECARRHGFEVLYNTERFFWRREPVEADYFEVTYDRGVIARCPTVSEGGEAQTCVFEWTTRTPTPKQP